MLKLKHGLQLKLGVELDPRYHPYRLNSLRRVPFRDVHPDRHLSDMGAITKVFHDVVTSPQTADVHC